HIPLLCKFHELWHPHHMPIIRHDFTAKSAVFKPRKTHEIYRCLCVSIALKDATRLCNQWKHMAGASKIFGTAVGINDLHGRDTSLCCGDACGGIYMINGDSKGSLVIVCVM